MSNKRATNWTAATDFETVCLRANGRRHYNALRQFRALMRRSEIVRLAVTKNISLFEHGFQARLARELGVHRSTVNRDLWAMMREARSRDRCPLCGSRVVFERGAQVIIS